MSYIVSSPRPVCPSPAASREIQHAGVRHGTHPEEEQQLGVEKSQLIGVLVLGQLEDFAHKRNAELDNDDAAPVAEGLTMAHLLCGEQNGTGGQEERTWSVREQ